MRAVPGRFEAASIAELVQWAAEYFIGHADMIERSHTDEYGRIRPAETRIELKFLKDWIARADALAPPAIPRSVIPGQSTGRPWTVPRDLPPFIPTLERSPHWKPDPRQPRPDPRQPQPDPREKRPPAEEAPKGRAELTAAELEQHAIRIRD